MNDIITRLKELEAAATPEPWNSRYTKSWNGARLSAAGSGPLHWEDFDKAKRDGDLIAEIRNNLKNILSVLDAAKEVANTLNCVQSALRDVKSVYNDHEQVLFGSGMRHDLTNLWNCSEYIEELQKTLAKLEGKS